MITTYKPKGVCAQLMKIETEGSTVRSVNIVGGCSGNLQGISRLIEGMQIEEAAVRLRGIKCGFKNTSCPDQLAQALEGILKGEKNL